MTKLKNTDPKPQLSETAVSRSVTLIPMVDFVLKQDNYKNYFYGLHSIQQYALFLNKPLKLEMFIPIDDFGDLLSDSCKRNDNCVNICQGRCNEDYYDAISKILFEGFSVFKRKDYYVLLADDYPSNHEIWVSWNESKTVQDLLYLSPKLTKNALDILGLADFV